VVKRVKYSFQDNFPYVFPPALAGRGSLRNPSLSPPWVGYNIIKYARKCASAGAKHPDALTKQGHAVTKQGHAVAKHP